MGPACWRLHGRGGRDTACAARLNWAERELGLREARNGAEGNGPPAAEKDWATGEKPRKERKNKESIFYFHKHNFKFNLNSPNGLCSLSRSSSRMARRFWTGHPRSATTPPAPGASPSPSCATPYHLQRSTTDPSFHFHAGQNLSSLPNCGISPFLSLTEQAFSVCPMMPQIYQKSGKYSYITRHHL